MRIGFLLLQATFLCGLLSASLPNCNSAEPDKAALLALYQRHVFTPGNQDDAALPYRLLVPEKIEAGKKYPLVLLLHGAGERGEDNEIQLVHGASEFAKESRRRDYPAFVLVPQCPKDQRWVESDWDLESGRGQFLDMPSSAMSLALNLVDEISAAQPVDLDRRYVTGLSMGGMGAWFAAAQKPGGSGDAQKIGRFAAMLAICGGGDPDWAPRYNGVAVWAFHGQSDRVVPIQRGREMIRALTAAGHVPELRYVEYPGVGHDSWTQTFAREDVFRWLFSQVRVSP